MTSKAGLTYSYTDTLHRHAVIALSDGSVYQYDRNGNMTTRIEGSVTYTQAWDIQNRLTQVVSGSQVSRYEYDADGRMVKKVESTGVTLYVSEDYEVIWSTPPVTATSTYTHKLYLPMMANSTGMSADNALVRVTYRFNGQPIAVREGITLTYLLNDHLSTVSAAADENGAVVGRQLYAPYGELRSVWGNVTGSWGWATQRKAEGTGLIYMRARWYSPLAARFISPDSVPDGIGTGLGHARYDYGRGNPIRYNDPTGHCPMCVTALIGAVVGAAIGAVMAAAPQMIENIQSGQPLLANIDPNEVAKGAAVGAIAGAISGLTFGVATAVMGTGLGATVTAGAISGVASGQAGKATENVLEGRDVGSGLLNPDDMGRDALLGAGGAALGYGIGKIAGALASKADDALTRVADDAMEIGATCSFDASTPIATKDGEQAISTIRIGEQVLAYNEALQANGYYTVTATWVHEDPIVLAVVIDGEVITTTPEHPFYTPMHGWLSSGELWSGVLVQNAEGQYGVVESVTPLTRTQQMYNLTVDEAHTFFAGDGQWLVHNICSPKGGTYRLIDPKTDETVYVGRTRNLVNRQIQHSNDPAKELYQFVVDKKTDLYILQRGREQVIFDDHINKYGTKPLLNKIRPISDVNPLRNVYIQSAIKKWGAQ